MSGKFRVTTTDGVEEYENLSHSPSVENGGTLKVTNDFRLVALYSADFWLKVERVVTDD